MTSCYEERVVVRDRDGIWQVTVGDWASLTMLASLSDDPCTFDELGRAWLRYRADERLEDLPWFETDAEPRDSPWVLIDLACQRVVAGGGAAIPENPGGYQEEEGPWKRGMKAVWMHLPSQWECVADAQWSDALPPLPETAVPLNIRGILFGRGLAEGIAQRCLDIAHSQSLPDAPTSWCDRDWDETPTQSQRAAAKRWLDLVVRVHADWLLTAREDLGGECPRVFLHQERDWISEEISNRERQWMDEQRAPRGLDRDTFAYRYGPMGLHEVVMYFDLCRTVIHFAWDQIVEQSSIDQLALAAKLQDHARWWLNNGSIDDDPTTPAAIIDTERRRLPLVGDGHSDCDCPICRMEGDNQFGPMFQCFDGNQLELDEEFAFSLCASRSEWQEQQGEFQEMSKSIHERMMAKRANEPDPLESVWKSSYVNEKMLAEAGGLSSPFGVMALASRMAELVMDLKEAGAVRSLIQRLNVAFDTYRKDPLVSKPLIDALEKIAAVFPDLTPKVADLQSQLDARKRSQVG